MIINEIKEALSSGNIREYRKFGITMAVVFAIISSVLFWNSYPKTMYYVYIAMAFLILALTFPIWLKYLYNIWMTCAALMGYVMSRLILSLIFIIMFTPVGIISRLIRKDLLKEKIDKKAESYWILRENESFSPKSAENQY